MTIFILFFFLPAEAKRLIQIKRQFIMLGFLHTYSIGKGIIARQYSFVAS